MKLFERTFDVVTGESSLEDLHSLPDFPVFMGSVDTPKTDDMVADMCWSISRSSGLIQLKNLLPLDVLYQAQTTTSAVGAIWMEHHREFAKYISKYDPTAVLELGGAHGILSIEYQSLRKIPWTILEPNPSPAPGCDAQFIKGFFDNHFSFTDHLDAVVHSHVFEHMYEPDQFMKNLSGFMREGQCLIFSLPNLQVWLERKYTNCINFEHTVFLTEPYVDYLLAKHGYRLLNKEYFRDGHSIFYAAVRDTSVEAHELPANLYVKNKKTYTDYVEYHEKLIREINLKINELNCPVYLFGAHVFSQYLIAHGLRTDQIISLLDNDPMKHGRRLYGTDLMVDSPQVLGGVTDPVVILKAGVYNEEIKEGILSGINSRTVFWE